MDKRTLKYLWDILEYTGQIEEMVGESTFEEYTRDRRLMLAVERCFEIIGVALSEAEKLRTDLPISDKPKIIGMRNIIAHGYDTIESVNVWNAIKKNLPLLKREVE